LHRECANAARCAINEHLLSGLNMPHVAQALQRRNARNPDRTRFLERKVRRLQRNATIGTRTNVLRERAVAAAEYFIAHLTFLPIASTTPE